MHGLTLKATAEDIKKLETEALIVGFYEDVRPLKGRAGELDWLLCGALSRLIIDNRLSGSTGDIALLTSQGKVRAKKIFMIGLGLRDGLTPRSVKSAAAIVAKTVLNAEVSRAAFEFIHPSGMSYDAALGAVRAGLKDGSGGRSLEVFMIAPDTAACGKIVELLFA